MTDEPTTNELGRRFDRLESSIDRGFAEIKDQLRQTVSTEVFTLYQAATERRFEAAETAITRTDNARETDRSELEAKIAKAEESRATDRRALAKLVAVWAGAILATVTGFGVALLPFIFGG